MMKPAIPYIHTGLTFRCVYGGLDLAHVRVDFPSARVELKDCCEAVNDSVRALH